MKDFIEGMVTKGTEVTKLKDKVETGKARIEALKDQVDGLSDEIVEEKRRSSRLEVKTERRIEDIEDESAREISNIRSEVEDKVEEAESKAAKTVEKVEFEASRDISRTKDTAENRVRRIKEETEHRISLIEEANEEDVKQVKLNAQTIADNAYCNDIEDLKDRLATAEKNEAGAEATAEERRGVIETLQGELNKHDELIRFVMTKLPNIDLSKFNINIDIPAPTVVTTGKGGQQQGKKDK